MLYQFLRGGVVTWGSKHLTPASSKWTQLCWPIALAGQLKSLISEPTHRTLSSRIGPVPCPKNAKLIAVAPVPVRNIAKIYTASVTLMYVRIIMYRIGTWPTMFQVTKFIWSGHLENIPNCSKPTIPYHAYLKCPKISLTSKFMYIWNLET